jgi:hypothetical protein
MTTITGYGGGDFDSDEAKTRGKRTKEQVQAKNRNKNNTFQSDTPAGPRIGKGIWTLNGCVLAD